MFDSRILTINLKKRKKYEFYPKESCKRLPGILLFMKVSCLSLEGFIFINLRLHSLSFQDLSIN